MHFTECSSMNWNSVPEKNKGKRKQRESEKCTSVVDADPCPSLGRGSCRPLMLLLFFGKQTLLPALRY